MSGPDTASDSLPTSLSLLSRLRDTQNASGWNHFVDTYGGLMQRVAVRAGLQADEARDVVQEAMIDVARQMPKFRYDGQRGSFKGWLCTVVRRRIIDYWRKLERRPSVPDLEPQVDHAWAEEWQRYALAVAVDRVRLEVPALQFQAFDLHMMKDQPVDKVARRLGISSASVYWAKYRVSRHLRRILAEIENG
jgi:RNA polymerase sigma-70 factor, ECF subfamily